MLRRNWFCTLCCVLLGAGLAGEATADEERPCVLELRNGNFVRGSLGGIVDDRVEWNSEHFTKPLQFPISHVDGMKFAPDESRPKPVGEFLVELNNRDTFYADVKTIDGQTIEVDSPHFGGCKLRLDAVRRLSRNGPDMKVYPVPSRLDGWTTSDKVHWRSEGSSLVSDADMASLYADVGLPEKAVVELEISWAKSPRTAKNPSFSIYIGTDESETARKKAFSIEVWDTYAVVQRQTKDDADLASLQDVKEAGSMHVFAYLDQTNEQLIMYDASGKMLADLKVPSQARRTSGLMFLNRAGQFRLNYLQIRGWSGTKPTDLTDRGITVATKIDSLGGESISLNDGMISLSSAAKSQSAGREQANISLEDVVEINFPSQPTQGHAGFVAGYPDGSRISGELMSSDDETVSVRVAASAEPLRLPIQSLRGFAVHHDTPTKPFDKSSPTGFRFGKLELMDTRLSGWLVDGEASETDDADASCLIWQSALASNSSPLKKNAFGHIVYREPPKPQKVVKQQNRMRAQMIFAQGIAIPQKKPARVRTASSNSSLAVHLRSGDVIPCTVQRIDERGVHIESTMTESKLLRHDQVKAAQLITNAPIPLLSRSKRERLLTLPRMQKNSPPLHLLFSKKGDVLRGTLLALNSDELEMEVRLNPHSISRDRVATIIWLHEDEMAAADEERPNLDEGTDRPGQDDRLMVQVVRNAGTRYSFYAESVADQTIHGSSEILKTMHAGISEIDQLLIGDFIKGNAKTLTFGRWHLTAATNPKFVTADKASPGSTETTPGTESLLIGKLAPDIRLKMLDQKTDFRLADHRGHCVVLDFWATWCGPCLQVMPIVKEVVAEFQDKDVQLFAVNLEERPADIKATLERRQLDVPVVLDRDGVAAARYEANAIPQTVVIGPDGTVARVFVGSSRQFTDQLREALTELTE